MIRQPTDFARHLSGYFINHLAGEMGVSENTIASRRTSFTLLIGYCNQQEGITTRDITIRALDRDLICRFLEWLENERGNCIATRNIRLDAVKTFFAYLQTVAPEHLLQCQQVLAIPRKKAQRETVSWLTREAVSALFHGIESSTYGGLRDLALLMLLYDSAARVSELAETRVRDLRTDDPACVRLLGKGRKERNVPLMSGTVDIVEKYLAQRNRRAPYTRDDFLFVNRSGRKLTRGGITHILRKHCEIAMERSPESGIRMITPHQLRHSKAVHMLQGGVPLIYIRDFLGHVEMSTTEIYARCEASAVREALEKGGRIEVEVDEPMWQRDGNMLSWLESLSE